MATQDLSSLIDWNSPVVEFHCKPLIPLPNFDGQPGIDGDNPFDALEKKIDQNEPFDMILNQSLNSSSEEIDLDNIMEIKNERLPSKSDEMNSVACVVDVFNQLNLHVDDSVPKNDYSVDISNVNDISPIASDVSEVEILRKRLFAIIDKFSTPSGEDRLIKHVNHPISSSVPSSSEISFYSIKSASVRESDVDENSNSSGLINKAFIGKNSTNDTIFDLLTFNNNNMYEDLNFVNPPTWISSGSDEEPENSPIKILPTKKSSNLKNRTSAEKVEMKSCPQLPLGSKDPNIRAKRKVAVVKEAGPLKAIIPVENMAKNANLKLVETPKHNRFSRKLKVDSTSSKLKRRSMPIATSTPVVTPSLSSTNKSKIASSSYTLSKPSTPSTQSSKSCPPSPDSTSAYLIPKSITKTKVRSRRLALNVSSSTSFNYLPSSRKPLKDVKHSSLNSSVKSTATGVKSGAKNKENLIPFRF